MARSRMVAHVLDDSLAEAPLNIRPIMNLFVILIPFLLLSASFVNYSVIPTAPPATGSASPAAALPDLQVTLKSNGPYLELKSASGRRLKRSQYRWNELDRLSSELDKIKGRFPKLDSATLKVSQGVSYEKMIQAMDEIRGSDVEGGADQVRFPSIVLGGGV